MALNLVYALKGNEIVFVDDVEIGKKCGLCMSGVFISISGEKSWN